MKSKIIFVFLILPLFVILGCDNGDGDGSDTSPTDIEFGQSSDKERITIPIASQESVSSLVEGNTSFALDLYHFLTNEKPDENRFFSPYSISMCFAMAYGGARDNTESQMEDIFHFTLGQENLHSAFNALDLDLLSREQDYDHDGEQDFKLNVANSMWSQTDYEFLIDYLDLLAENYGAGIRFVDLQNDPVGSCDAINSWVNDKSEGLIDSIISPADLNSFSLFVLVNAIYFKAIWADEFNEEATQNELFHAQESDVTVPMMHQWCYVDYSEGENYQAAGIPYKGDKIEMLVLLPKQGSFGEFESSLTIERIDQIIADFEYQEVVLKLPRFECRPEQIDLKDILSQMGMTDAFISKTGDFSGMDGVPNWIYLHFARHKSFVTVDEHGTEAAAATVIGGGIGYPVTPDIEFIVDRPFIFFIRDRVTGTILFLGRILNPLA